MNKNDNIPSQPQQLVLNNAVLRKEKLQPFGSHFLVKLNEANYKLMCSLSAANTSDYLTDTIGPPPP
jgi:hypothetical protein